MNIVAIVQARMGSTRLPGKILMRIAGETVLGHLLKRLKTCRNLNAIVVATTEAPADEAVVAESQKHGVSAFRGSEQDVLSRYYLAAKATHADVVVRITSDCPLFDPVVLDQMLARFIQRQQSGQPVDYLSNVQKRTYPRGLDTEIFTFAALEKTHHEALKPHEREHVTPYIYQHPELFRIESFENPEDWSEFRWTLDTPEDFQLIEAIYQALYDEKRLFSTADVLNLLKGRPELVKLNAHVEQKKLG